MNSFAIDRTKVSFHLKEESIFDGVRWFLVVSSFTVSVLVRVLLIVLTAAEL